MAILNLPNGSSYDDTLTFEAQSDEAKEYAYSVLELPHDPTLDVEEFCGNDLASNPVNRLLSRVHKNVTDGFKVTYSREYINIATSGNDGVKRHTNTLTAI